MDTGIRHSSLPPPNACNTRPGDGNPVPGFFFSGLSYLGCGPLPAPRADPRRR